MKVDKSGFNAYLIHKISDTNIKLCKVLNEYNSMEEADKALIDLLTNRKTEKEILKDYGKKDIF